MNRSWTRKPKNLDVEFYKEKYAKYADPDGDDAKFVQLQQARSARDKVYKAKLAEMKKK